MMLRLPRKVVRAVSIAATLAVTLVLLPGGVAGSAPGAPVSDEFNAASVNTSLWTVHNPVGDGTVVDNGSQLVMSYPAGLDHDVWAGGNRSLGLFQPVANGNLQVDAKFDTLPGAAYQSEGILAEQDSNTRVRMDVFYDGSTLRVFAATFTGGVPTAVANVPITDSASSIWLRMQRTGNTWTESWSSDGTTFSVAATFTFTLALAQIGPFSGNAGRGSSPPPAWTVKEDYFRNTTPTTTGAPPVISAVSVAPSSTSAAVSWTTDVAASSVVNFGLTSSYGSQATGAASTTSHSVTLTGLTCATTYHYAVSSADTAGTSSSPDASFATAACGSTPGAPVSDEFNAASVNTSLWTVHNPVGDGTVVDNGSQLVMSYPAGLDHDVWAGGNRSLGLFQPVANGNLQVDAKFDTLPGAAYQSEGILAEQDSNTRVRMDVFYDGSTLRVFAATFTGGVPTAVANVPITDSASSIWLRMQRTGNTWTESWSSDGTTFSVAATFTFTLALAQIGPFSGNAGRGSSPPPAWTVKEDYFRNTTPTTTGAPPVISAVSVAPSSTSAAVSWTTDVAASSVVNFGLTSSYGSQATGAASTTSHSVTLTGLTCATTYHYAVSSADAAGTSSSPDASFATAACGSTPGAPVSDEFNAASVNTSLWTVHNPVGDGTVVDNGSQLVMSYPAGLDHDVWAGGNRSLGLFQPVANGNLQVDAKFDTLPGAAYQSEGILAEQDSNTRVRMDVFYDGSTLRVFAATFTGGVPTAVANVPITDSASSIWLRMQRTGNTWTESWSSDGTTFSVAATFTFTLALAQIGPFSGNAGRGSSPPPAWTVKEDYFRNTTPTTTGAPPVISVWYGQNQTFGAIGRPQQWVNILGNVSDPVGVAQFELHPQRRRVTAPVDRPESRPAGLPGGLQRRDRLRQPESRSQYRGHHRRRRPGKVGLVDRHRQLRERHVLARQLLGQLVPGDRRHQFRRPDRRRPLGRPARRHGPHARSGLRPAHRHR